MAEPFLSEIRIMSFNFAPKGWAMCNGHLYPINQNQALFALLGTTFGGDGRVNFALPDLRGDVPIHVGSGFGLGASGGEATHTVTNAEMPLHTHVANGSTQNASVFSVSGNVNASVSGLYGPPQNLTSLHPTTVTNTGGSQSHVNRQPFLTLTFCIALQGIFPSQN